MIYKESRAIEYPYSSPFTRVWAVMMQARIDNVFAGHDVAGIALFVRRPGVQ
jgi:hypothetical protein